MTENLTFSLASECDIAEIMAVYRSLAGTPGGTWDDDYPNEELAREDLKNSSLYVLKDTSGRIISVASAGACDELVDVEWSMENLCDLARIGVVADMHGHGVASLMVDHIIAAATARGYDGIRLIAAKGNLPALALYEKHGFKLRCEAHLFGHDFFCYELKF